MSRLDDIFDGMNLPKNLSFVNERQVKAKQQIKDLMLELIGEDTDSPVVTTVNGYNAKLRQKVNEL